MRGLTNCSFHAQGRVGGPLFFCGCKEGNRFLWKGLGLCVKTTFLTKYIRDQKWARGQWYLNVFLSFNRTYACKTHQKDSVRSCKSLLLFLLSMFLFNLYVQDEGALRMGGVLSNMTGRVTRFTSTFQSGMCFRTKSSGDRRDQGLTQFTDTFCAQTVLYK